MVLDYGTIGLQTTPTAGALFTGSKLQQAEAGYQAALNAKVGYAERSLAGAYAQAFKQVEKEAEALANYVAKAQAEGKYSPSWLMRDARYKSLLNQYSAAIKTFNSATMAQVNAVHQAGIQAALAHTPTQIRDYMGATAPTGVLLPDFGPEYWGRVNKEAMARVTGYLNQQDAPLRNLIGQLGADTLHAVQTEFAKGFALGYNPKKIARNVANATANIALGRARTIARTEFHRAYREVKGEQIAASDVTSGWVWKASLGTACGLCTIMAGSLHPKGDVMDSHPNCRCAMVPLTKSWADLGFPGVAGDRPAALDVPSGPDWLAQQTYGDRDKILGKARNEAFTKGLYTGASPTAVARSFVRQTSNPTWGPMKQLAPMGKGKMQPGTFTPPPPPTPAPAPVAVPPTPKPKPAPSTAPKPQAAPKPAPAAPAKPAPAPSPNAGLSSYFSKVVKPVKAAQTALGKKFLTGRTTSASSAKQSIAANISGLSEKEYNRALREWDGEWSAYHGANGMTMVPTTGSYYSSTLGRRYALPKPWAQMTVAERDAYLSTAEGAALREDLTARMIQTWASTSADNSPLSLLAQMRAEKIFGMQAQTSHLSNKNGWAQAAAAPKPMVDIMDSTLRSMYRHTQAEFAAEGITRIKLTRGQSWTDGRPAWTDGMVKGEHRQGYTMIQPMSSFSSSKAVARRFLHGGYGSGGAYFITADFPVEWIIGSARTGFGCLNEYEFVVMSGGPMHVNVEKASW